MKIVTVCKSNITGDTEAQPVTIVIESKLPEIGGYQSEMYDTYFKLFYSDANGIFEALKDSLPGGTWARLIALMLKYEAENCYFAVGVEG